MRNSIEFIGGKEAAEILSTNLRNAQALLARVRAQIGRKPYRPVSVEEFCLFTNMDPADVIAYKLSQIPGVSNLIKNKNLPL